MNAKDHKNFPDISRCKITDFVHACHVAKCRFYIFKKIERHTPLWFYLGPNFEVRFLTR